MDDTKAVNAVKSASTWPQYEEFRARVWKQLGIAALYVSGGMLAFAAAGGASWLLHGLARVAVWLGTAGAVIAVEAWGVALAQAVRRRRVPQSRGQSSTRGASGSHGSPARSSRPCEGNTHNQSRPDLPAKRSRLRSQAR